MRRFLLLCGLLAVAQPAVGGRELAEAAPPRTTCSSGIASRTQLVLPLAPRGAPDAFAAYRNNSVSYAQGSLSSLHAVLAHLSTTELLPCTTHVAVAFPGAKPELLPDLFKCWSKHDFVILETTEVLSDCRHGCTVRPDMHQVCPVLLEQPTDAANDGALPALLVMSLGVGAPSRLAIFVAQLQLQLGQQAEPAEPPPPAVVEPGAAAALPAPPPPPVHMADSCFPESVAAVRLIRSLSSSSKQVCSLVTAPAEGDGLGDDSDDPSIGPNGTLSIDWGKGGSTSRWLAIGAVAALVGLGGPLLRAYGRSPAVYGMVLNVVSSVGIIMINKVLFTMGFKFASSLLGLNFAATSALALCRHPPSRREGAPPAAAGADAAVVSAVDMSLYVGCIVLSLIGGQFSLMLNSVGFYQISKLMMIPTSCVFEFFLQGRRFSPPVLACIALLLFGVGLTTAADVSMKPLGLFMAAMGVVTSSGQQVLVSYLQQKYNLNVAVFVASSSQYVALTLLILGPFLDRYISGLWVADWMLESPNRLLVAELMFLSSTVAVLVNWSQAVAIVHTSAVAFQVLGHVKTVIILTLGWCFFDSHFSYRRATSAITAHVAPAGWGWLVAERAARGGGSSMGGGVLALLAMLGYSVFRQREQAAAAAAAAVSKLPTVPEAPEEEEAAATAATPPAAAPAPLK